MVVRLGMLTVNHAEVDNMVVEWGICPPKKGDFTNKKNNILK